MLIRCACLYSVCSLTGNLVYGYKLKQCDELLSSVLRNYRVACRSSRNVTSATAKLEHCLTEHTRICAHILFGNSKIWSSIMFYFITTNIPSNSYFVVHLLFDKMPLLESFIYTVLLCVQLIAAVFVLLRLAKNSKLIHGFSRYVPAVQQILHGRQFISLKLKYDDLLHRLTSTKYGMTVGPIFLVTYESVFKVNFWLNEF